MIFLFNKKSKHPASVKGILIFFSIWIVIGVIFFTITGNLDQKELEEFHQKHIKIVKSDSLSGIVLDIHCDRGIPVLHVDSNKYFWMAHSSNYDYEIFEICCFIESGDSLLKRSDSDTLHIYRKDKEFYFIIGQTIGKKYYSNFYRNPCQ